MGLHLAIVTVFLGLRHKLTHSPPHVLRAKVASLQSLSHPVSALWLVARLQFSRFGY